MSEEKLKQLESKVTELKEKKIRTEEQLKSLRTKKDEITAELAALGVAPKDLDTSITALNAQIQSNLSDIDSQIPETL